MTWKLKPNFFVKSHLSRKNVCTRRSSKDNPSFLSWIWLRWVLFEVGLLRVRPLIMKTVRLLLESCNNANWSSLGTLLYLSTLSQGRGEGGYYAKKCSRPCPWNVGAGTLPGDDPISIWSEDERGEGRWKECHQRTGRGAKDLVSL